jgi:hypothetical protein
MRDLVIALILLFAVPSLSLAQCQGGNCSSGDIKLRKFVPMAFVQQSRVASKFRARRINRKGR